MKKIIDYLSLLGTACLISLIGLLLIFFVWARWVLLGTVFVYMLIQYIKYKMRISQVKTAYYTRFPTLKESSHPQLLWYYLADELDMDRCSLWWEQDWIHKRLTNNLTVLHLIAGMGKKEECAWLLNCKADPNAKDDNGLTPLDYAKKFNETEVIKLLENYSKK